MPSGTYREENGYLIPNLSLPDEEQVEIDKLNMIFKVQGNDQLGDVRKALGLG